MLRKLDEGTGNVLGYEVEGKLTEGEFEVISEEIEAVITRHGKVRLLIRMNEMPRMEPGALLEDLKLARMPTTSNATPSWATVQSWAGRRSSGARWSVVR